MDVRLMTLTRKQSTQLIISTQAPAEAPPRVHTTTLYTPVSRTLPLLSGRPIPVTEKSLP